MFIVNYRKIFFGLSIALILGSVVAFVMFGFNLGIDFKGGSILEVSYDNQRPSLDSVKSELDTLNLGTYILTPSGNSRFILKTREISIPEKSQIMSVLSDGESNPAKEERFN